MGFQLCRALETNLVFLDSNITGTPLRSIVGRLSGRVALHLSWAEGSKISLLCSRSAILHANFHSVWPDEVLNIYSGCVRRCRRKLRNVSSGSPGSPGSRYGSEKWRACGMELRRHVSDSRYEALLDVSIHAIAPVWRSFLTLPHVYGHLKAVIVFDGREVGARAYPRRAAGPQTAVSTGHRRTR